MTKSNALTSGILMLSASWIAKTLGLLSTIILARLLSPEDFGLVAITMLVIHFLHVFAQTGAQQYLLSKNIINDDDLNTAWSINIILHSFIALLLFCFAGLIADFFKADLTLALKVSSFILIIIGLNNPAISIAKREFKYSGIFKLALLVKFISFSVTITIAFYTHSYWALIIGSICHYTVNTIGSYFIYPYKPSFCLKNFRQQWGFSKWVLLRGFTGYIRSKGDAFLIAKFFTTSEIGLFTVAKDFAMLVYEQIATPIAEIIMTSVQKTSNNKGDIPHIVEKYLLILISLLAPIICLLSLLSESIVTIILGEKWLAAAPILTILTLLGVSTSITVVFNSTLTALKRTKLTFKIDIITTIIILTTLFLLKDIKLINFAILRTALDASVLISYLMFTKWVIGLSLRSTLKNLTPTLIATCLMAIVVSLFADIITISNFLNLVLVSGISLIVYLFVLIILVNSFPYAGHALLELKTTINRICKNTYQKTIKNMT
jgi:lipopolysaccharide exporter